MTRKTETHALRINGTEVSRHSSFADAAKSLNAAMGKNRDGEFLIVNLLDPSRSQRTEAQGRAIQAEVAAMKTSRCEK